MNNIKIVTYSSPQDSIISEICDREDVLHICATASLTEAMIGKFNKRKNVISAKWFIDALLDEWMDMSTKLEQMMSLSELVRKGSKENLKDEPITRAVRRHKSDALLTIRMLTEVGIKPQDLYEFGRTEYEKELSKLWEKMVEKDEESGHFKKLGSFNFAIKRPFALKMMINERLKEKYNKDIEIRDRLKVCKDKLNLEGSVVLHGFYFLTPIQQSVFQTLKKAGVNITFLQLYNPEYPETFSFIENVLGEENGWIPKSNWIVKKEDENQEHTLAPKVAGFFEDRPSMHLKEHDKKRVTQVCYKNLYQWMKDFKKDFENLEEGPHHLTVVNQELNTKIEEFFPEHSLSERNFLSYPVGQYLLHLHKIWDQEKKKQEVDLITLQECFVSPWLHTVDRVTGEKRFASDYVYQMQFLDNFFPPKMTMQEWKVSIKKLIKDTENSPFLIRDIPGKPEHHRFLDEIKNPIKKVAPYSIPAEDWKLILEFLSIMDSHINILFNDMDHLFSFKEYFGLLGQIITKQLPEEKLLKHEKEMLKRIKKISYYYESSPSGKQYHIEDIAEAVHLLLSAQFEEEPSPEVKQEKKALRIRSFAEIDGIIFDEKRNIHVSGMDEFSFPHSESSIPWPLTIETVKNLCDKVDSLKVMVIREKHKDIIPRFLFYILLSGDQELTLSWLRERGDKNSLGSSFYLKILEEVDQKSESYIEEIKDPTTPSEELKNETAVYSSELSHYSDYALSELNICQRRFFYSYLTQPFSVYTSDFHYSFIYGNLYKLLSKFDPKPASLIEDVFPYWTKFKQKAKAATAESYSNERIQSFEYADEKHQALSGIKYLINLSNKEDGWRRAWKNEGYNLTQSSIELFKASPSSSCKYCPHEKFCPSARYAVDDERYEG
ncbi:hypothetical protein [Peribacillus sp. TH27]|uniref:hypothetical protein n=1 Tax=Peribacillus sp. TH27 TaxID=2798484 RepID=UPI0019124F6B|nr:hypothetical protein [Peribacillus sp. TH27]MBK5462004.1 hypothetical protein [Peribacillus sp. TH27]